MTRGGIKRGEPEGGSVGDRVGWKRGRENRSSAVLLYAFQNCIASLVFARNAVMVATPSADSLCV